MHQFRTHLAGKATLRRIFARPEATLIVHYSCESFSLPEGRSPRVTSIAVRNLGTARTDSFSIHQMAERNRVALDQIAEQYDKLEAAMLREFYDYVSKNLNSIWVHWNMRDVNFGFPALAHRFRVLGGAPKLIPEENLIDAARLMVALYGVRYMNHPRMENLFKENDITVQDFLTGADEATAFEKKEYVKLHRSTLRKVDNIANVLERVVVGNIRIKSRWRDRYGLTAKDVVLACQSHPLISLCVIVIGVFGSFASVCGVSLRDCKGAHSDGAAPDPVGLELRNEGHIQSRQ